MEVDYKCVDTMAKALYNKQLRRWINGIANLLFVYDLILTARDEYRYIWRRKMSIGKLLYILVRYPFSLVALAFDIYYNAQQPMVTVPYCKAMISWHIIGGSLHSTLVQVVTGLRTAALYNFTPVATSLVGILGFASSVAIIGIDVLHSSHSKFSTSIPALQEPCSSVREIACYKRCSGGYFICNIKYMLLPMVIFEGVVFLMTLYKHHKNSNHAVDMQTRLLWILYRDGFFYFALIFSSIVVNVLLHTIADHSLAVLLAPLLRSLLVNACGRLLLNLRGAILQQPFGDATTTATLQHPNHTYTNASAGVGRWNVPTDHNSEPIELKGLEATSRDKQRYSSSTA